MATATKDQTRRLATLYNRSTLYEVVVSNGADRRLLGYCDRSRRRLRDMMLRHGEAIVALTGADTFEYGKRADDGLKVGAWTIAFSGRTERDAILEGELPLAW